MELEEEENDDDDCLGEGEDSELELVEEEENEEVLDSSNKRRGQKMINKRNKGDYFLYTIAFVRVSEIVACAFLSFTHIMMHVCYV